MPVDLTETSALLFVTRMLQQSDMVAVVSTDVARYHAAHAIVAMLPIQLPWRMDAFGIDTRTDRPLSLAAQLMLRAFKTAA